jgi:hypothetical protein
VRGGEISRLKAKRRKRANGGANSRLVGVKYWGGGGDFVRGLAEALDEGN